MHVYGEGGSGEKQGEPEKEWWEGDRRERENGEKQVWGERREDNMREREVRGREGGGRGRKVGGRKGAEGSGTVRARRSGGIT